MVRLSLAEAADLATSVFVRAGVPENAARDAADHLTTAEAMGITTHGLLRVQTYVDRINAGGIDAKASYEVTVPAPALRHTDGRCGLGPAIAARAMDAAMVAARDAGIGATFVRGGSHLGAFAPLLYRAAEGGFAALCTTNTAPMIAPAGGREPRIGNNPLGVAIPDPKGAHVILDMALTMVSRSRVRERAKAGLPIPNDWATDANGQPTSEASVAMEGLLSAIGGGKGASLALCLDLIAGGLSGASMLTEVGNAAREPGVPQNLGYVIIAIDARRLVTERELADRMATARQVITSTTPTEAGVPVRMPGDRALTALRSAKRDGLSLSSELINELRELADQ